MTSDVEKGVTGSEKLGHKYLRRKPKAGGGYSYEYHAETGGKRKNQKLAAIDMVARLLLSRRDEELDDYKHIQRMLNLYLRKHKLNRREIYNNFGLPHTAEHRKRIYQRAQEHLDNLDSARLAALTDNLLD